MDEVPIFLRIPSEVRVLIYEQLLSTGESNCIVIRSLPRQKPSDLETKHRSKYTVLERTFALRRAYKTTYGHAGGARLHPAILAVNRRIREEASHWLYGLHSFDFGHALGAVAPFLADKSTKTRELIKEITLRKRGPTCIIEDDSSDWVSMCRYLRTVPSLRKLRVVIEGGRPDGPWDGPQTLSVSDIRLLYMIRHECFEWLGELAGAETIREVEIVADVKPMSDPKTSTALVYAAFSNSIETSLVEFLRTDLKMSARVTHGAGTKLISEEAQS